MSNLAWDTFTEFIDSDTKDNFTKKIINKIIRVLLDVYEKDFFLFNLQLEIFNKKMIRCEFGVEEIQGKPQKRVIVTDSYASKIQAFSVVLQTYNKHYDHKVEWNKLIISVHFEGEYRVSRALKSWLSNNIEEPVLIKPNIVDIETAKVAKKPADPDISTVLTEH